MPKKKNPKRSPDAHEYIIVDDEPKKDIRPPDFKLSSSKFSKYKNILSQNKDERK